MKKFEKKSQLVHALDVEKAEDALRIARDVKDYVDVIKISYPLVLREGKEVIKALREATPLPILACFKVGDIPEISGRIMRAALDFGADALTIHGIFGRDVVKNCIEIAKEYDAGTFVVAEMSHPGAEEYMQPVAEKIAKNARDLGATGIIAPATRPNRTRRFREIVGEEMVIISPGIGAQGGKIGDAILAGADYEIVGRSIYQSSNPKRMAQQLSIELKNRIKNSQTWDVKAKPIMKKMNPPLEVAQL
jgi:orotidine-5'-phosphate decarboxylase